ncbi:MAG TPA: hypothetical protein VJP80_03470 [Candidatus Saccharimonadales bacterium]|nr:hypothetical protein [Candidatus Saccharimonadales bacterium]
MKLVILYRPNSEHATDVETFARDFQRQHDLGSKLELQSVSTRDGAALASLYDVMSYPTILALADNGSVLSMWQGQPLPLKDEVVASLYH